jgi:hypothetical protein
MIKFTLSILLFLNNPQRKNKRRRESKNIESCEFVLVVSRNLTLLAEVSLYVLLGLFILPLLEQS